MPSEDNLVKFLVSAAIGYIASSIFFPSLGFASTKTQDQPPPKPKPRYIPSDWERILGRIPRGIKLDTLEKIEEGGGGGEPFVDINREMLQERNPLNEFP